MHDTAYQTGQLFFERYWQPHFTHIAEIGAYNVNGSLKEVCPTNASYAGIDYCDGPGVDMQAKPGEPLPLPDHTFDIILSSSTFEHDAFFWETFLDLVRVLKPGGFIYMSVPSNGTFHRCPSDYWRFYPDAGEALAQWARKKGQNVVLIESGLVERQQDVWNDFIAVFYKKGPHAVNITSYLTDAVPCSNVRRMGEKNILHERNLTQDMIIMRQQMQEIERLRKRVAELEGER